MALLKYLEFLIFFLCGLFGLGFIVLGSIVASAEIAKCDKIKDGGWLFAIGITLIIVAGIGFQFVYP